MKKTILVTAAILGALAIVLGAFAAHGLKEAISTESITTFETGVKYQMYHALFLLLVGIMDFLSMKAKKAIYFLTLVGTVFFSGSIYGLATNSLTVFNFKSIALITPVGGFLLISAWVVLLIAFLKLPKAN